MTKDPTPGLPGFPDPNAQLAEVGSPDGPPVKVPKRSSRYRVLPDGRDVRIFAMAIGAPGIPHGALVPVPEAPGFLERSTAADWLRANTPPELHGKRVAVVRFLGIFDLKPMQRTAVELVEKPRVRYVGPDRDGEAPAEVPQQ